MGLRYYFTNVMEFKVQRRLNIDVDTVTLCINMTSLEVRAQDISFMEVNNFMSSQQIQDMLKDY